MHDRASRDLQAALKHHQRGDIKKAEALYRKVLRYSPANPDALHLLGVVAYQEGRRHEAIDLISRAIAVNGRFPDYHKNLGAALKDSGSLETAVASFRRALELKPDDPQAHDLLGLTLREQGYLDEAIHSHREALRLMPGYDAARNHLGVALQERGRLQDAIACFREVLSARPDFAEVHNNLAHALQRAGYLDEAVSSCREAIRLKPALPEAHCNLGNALQESDRMDEAVSSYREALNLRPDYVKAHIGLGNALHELGRVAEATEQMDRALALKPDSVAARWVRCMAQIPICCDTEAEIRAGRARYREALLDLKEKTRVNTLSEIAAAAEAAALCQPFYLPFLGQDDRELQSLYGTLLCDIHAARYPRWAQPLPMPQLRQGEPIRVGVVSSFFQYHSNWKAPIRGWIENIDKSRFSLFGYYTGKKKDTDTESARRCFNRFVEDVAVFEDLCAEVQADRLHVLIYPEIGMAPVTARLAALRLAPVQCNSWGHADTSGLLTQDYYLGSDLMEPADGAEHYTEQLVRLPNLSIHYTPLTIEPACVDRSSLGIREGAVLYSCFHSLLTYLPQFDFVFPRIAREVDDCVFVFLGYSKSAAVTEKFRSRMERAFAREGLRGEDYIVILPHQMPPRFQALNRMADVSLDSFSWSGCNTTLEAVGWNLPVVTLPGDLMRGRHTYAIFTMMGVTDTIAGSVEEYISLAVRLGKQAELRCRIADRISASKHRIYGDLACVRGLERFLEYAVRQRAR